VKGGKGNEVMTRILFKLEKKNRKIGMVNAGRFKTPPHCGMGKGLNWTEALPVYLRNEDGGGGADTSTLLRFKKKGASWEKLEKGKKVLKSGMIAKGERDPP